MSLQFGKIAWHIATYYSHIITIGIYHMYWFSFLHFWQELIRWAEKVYQIAEEIGLNEVGLTIKGIESWNRQTLLTLRIIYIPLYTHLTT